MGNKGYLRPVSKNDMKLLFDWRNDEDCRNNSFSSKPIEWEEHKNWFMAMLANPNQKAFILVVDGNSVGQIRLVKCGEKAEISYSIATHERGKGYGKLILSLAENEIAVAELIGQVKSNNLASQKSFEALGYEKQEII